VVDESLVERLVQLKSMVDEVVGDPSIDDDASSLALLDAYMRIRVEVESFVYSLGEEQENLAGESAGLDSPLEWNFDHAFPYLPGRHRDPSEAGFKLRRLGDWLQHLIDVETLAQQWGGSRKAYRAAHVHFDYPA
jgi:hypothetical protein